MLKTVVAAAIACGTALPAQAADMLDLATYSVKLTNSLIAPSGVGFGEASGIAYDYDRNTLFVVGDEATVHEFALNGESAPGVFRYLGVSSFQDPEGFAYIGNRQYVIAEERTMTMWLLNVESEDPEPGVGYSFSQKRSGLSYALSPFNVGNIGLEGISYDPLTGGFFAVKQQNEQAVYFVDVDIRNPAGGSHSEIFDPALLGLTSLSDISVLSDVTSFAGTGFEDNLLIVSATSQKLIEVTRTGEVLSSFDLSNILGPTGQLIQTVEGVTLDREGNIYLAAEVGGIQGSALIVLERNVMAAVPEPATWAMMIGGFGLVGGAMRRRSSGGAVTA